MRDIKKNFILLYFSKLFMKKQVLFLIITTLFLVSCSVQSQQTNLGIIDMFNCKEDHVCMDGITEQILEVKAAKELLKELDKIGKTNNEVLIGCHPLAHSIGRTIYKRAQDLQEVFEQCDHTCHSGCYHGAMERVFFPDQGGHDMHVTPAMLREKTPSVCEQFQVGYGNLRFQCLHGLGHAVVFFSDYDLIEGLKLCDLLGTEWDRTSCYGGAFMENVVNVEKAKFLNNDPHYPCNSLEAKYQPSCYMMQTSRMLGLGLSYEEIGKECETLGETRDACMSSLGRDASNDARLNPDGAPVCETLKNERDTENCVRGLTNALNDNSWDGRYSFPYCESLANYKSYCFRTTLVYLRDSLRVPMDMVLESCSYAKDQVRCKTWVEDYY